MQFGLSENIIEHIQKVFEVNSKVDAVIIFGSRAKGNYKEGSDIDLAVKGRNISFNDIQKLSGQLDELNLPYKVDALNYDSISDKEVVEHIDRAGIIFYERWKKMKFSDFVQINPAVKLNSKEKVSFVEMKDLSDGRRSCYPSIERELTGGARFENNDTLFARITPCLENGKICQVKGLKNNVGFGSTEFLVFRGKKNISDNDFVFYLSRWDDVRNYAESHFEGTSGRQRVSKDAFGNLVLHLPPFKEQTSIADTLSSLDDKIDLLHRQNKTLEQLAEALFRQWFIEEAKDDWDVVKLGTLGHVICGKTPSKKVADYFNGDIPFIKIPDMHGRTFVFESDDSLTELGLNSQSKKTLPPKSICVSCIATVGLVVMNAKTAQTNQQINSIIPAKDTYRYFLYLKMISMKEELLAMASGGTATDNLNTGNFSDIDIILPTEKLLIEFDEKVKPLFEKIFTNQTQIYTLTNLRDTLLPKLMSGEVRVEITDL